MSETASQHADDVLGLFWLSEHYTPEAWATAVISNGARKKAISLGISEDDLQAAYAQQQLVAV